MRILLLGLNFHPELTGTGKFTGEMADWLAEAGHETRAITAPPYYPSWRIAPGFSAIRYTRRRERSGIVYRCPLWVPSMPNGLSRLIHLASFACSSFPVAVWQAATWRPDVVVTVAPTLFSAPGALAAGAIAQCATWLHIQDLELDAAFALGLLRRPLVHRLFSAAERSILTAFDRVSTITDAMAGRIRAKGVAAVEVLPNWTDIDTIRPTMSVSSFRSELGIGDDAVVSLYSGSFGEKQGIDLILEAARALVDDPRFVFVLCGDGPSRGSLADAVAGMANVRLLPLQPAARLNELLNVADIHLLPQRAGAADTVMPSKLMNMLASGRPVVATAGRDTALGRMIEDAGGLLSPPEDCSSLVRHVRALAASEEERRRRGEDARRYAERHLAKKPILERFRRSLLAMAQAGGIAPMVPS